MIFSCENSSCITIFLFVLTIWRRSSRQGVLRVLIRNDDVSYFIWRGRPHGFEYELVRRFADHHKLSLEMILAQSHDDLLAKLLDGTGDVVAASLVPNAEAQGMGVEFTRHYREIKPTGHHPYRRHVNRVDCRVKRPHPHRAPPSPSWPRVQEAGRSRFGHQD